MRSAARLLASCGWYFDGLQVVVVLRGMNDTHHYGRSKGVASCGFTSLRTLHTQRSSVSDCDDNRSASLLQTVPSSDSVCVVEADTLGTATLKDGSVFESTAGPPLRSSISPRTVVGALAVALLKIVTTIRLKGELS